MDGSDPNDHRTFRVNFSGDGAARLRERVKEKLKEYMGDYTDDTLVEYVIVLLRNGRHKEEAERELNVFLGDDNASFVSWLWDHLSSSLHLYVQTQESFPDEVIKTKPQLDKQSGRNNTQPEHLSSTFHSDSEHDKEKSLKESRIRRNREWKGLVRDVAEPPPLQSTEIDKFQSEEKIRRLPGRMQRSRSPRPVHKKRSRQDERQPMKVSAIDAPRRLLQFAVRDAVGTPRTISSRPEPALKRLRSVVSTSTGDSLLDDRSQRTRSVTRMPHPAATAIKAAAEAAEDVVKFRCAGNVFDRLGRGMAISEATSQPLELREPTHEDAEYEHFDQMPGVTHAEYLQRSEYSGGFEGDTTMIDRNTGLASDSASDNDGYDDPGIVRGRVIDASQSASSGQKDGNSLMVQYSVAKNVDEVARKARMKDHQQTAAATSANASRKIVNISVNVNTWKPSHYQAPREVTEVDSRTAVQDSEAVASKPGVRLVKESNMVVPGNDNELARADTQKEVQKAVQLTPGSYSTVRPSEDVDSRTVFVSNVHFAATKDSLSRHFNKFGDVLKVIIVTDAATGQPKGSAYIEFMRKEAAEHALSLNGTSFMSRILKVVRRASAHHEVSPVMAWPRVARASPFAARLARASFVRGNPNAFRARLPIKQGARSLQWKRDAPSNPTIPLTGDGAANLQNGATNSANSVPSPTGRNLTYIRTEPKQGVNAGPT
ncbi:nucleolin 1 [Magnolia sinica]|uniref:nucleolin 1 n=1 Tax=Magnolia sinica TaxID=86752 RepID=UPI0026582395|nr:nucleolin 1 [Magnolia sinica]